MIMTLPSSGLTANCIFEPPVSTPISRIMLMAMSLRFWYSLSVRVCWGATVMESPVWTPMGSIFSMEQMMTTLSLVSRITSSSNSFHPSTDSSKRTWLMGDSSRPFLTRSMKSSRLYTILPPVPPRVKAGLMMMGRLILSRKSRASSSDDTVPDTGTDRPILIIASLNSSRSSAFLIETTFAPISSTPHRSKTPLSPRSRATFRAVCPPTVGRTASGLSISIIFSTISGVMGSM